jgi:hypothetical protein
MNGLEESLSSERFLQILSQNSKDCILNIFRYANSRRQLKKENLRVQLIRSFKRAIREILSNKKLPINFKLHSFDPKEIKAFSLYEKLKSLVKEHSELQKLCLTECGPITDGKSKKKENSAVKVKSFNSEYCKEFFSSIKVREFYSYYIELVFSNFEPKVLCQKFKFLCCENTKRHTLDCLMKWSVMKRYLNVFFLLELNLDPIFQNEFITLPSIDFCLDEFE